MLGLLGCLIELKKRIFLPRLSAPHVKTGSIPFFFFFKPASSPPSSPSTSPLLLSSLHPSCPCLKQCVCADSSSRIPLPVCGSSLTSTPPPSNKPGRASAFLRHPSTPTCVAHPLTHPHPLPIPFREAEKVRYGG